MCNLAGWPAAPSVREREVLCASCISMVTMFFAHGPTVLTNRVHYDTKEHFLKIFFAVYSIIINTYLPIPEAMTFFTIMPAGVVTASFEKRCK